MRVYASGEREIRMMDREYVDEWVEYNSKHRFGVGLFVDGKCVWKGYLNQETVDGLERERAWVRQLEKVFD